MYSWGKHPLTAYYVPLTNPGQALRHDRKEMRGPWDEWLLTLDTELRVVIVLQPTELAAVSRALNWRGQLT